MAFVVRSLLTPITSQLTNYGFQKFLIEHREKLSKLINRLEEIGKELELHQSNYMGKPTLEKRALQLIEIISGVSPPSLGTWKGCTASQFVSMLHNTDNYDALLYIRDTMSADLPDSEMTPSSIGAGGLSNSRSTPSQTIGNMSQMGSLQSEITTRGSKPTNPSVKQQRVQDVVNPALDFQRNGPHQFNAQAHHPLTTEEKTREMKSYFCNMDPAGACTQSLLRFETLLANSHTEICKALPDACLLTVVRELQKGIKVEKILNDEVAEAILHDKLTPSQQKDKLVDCLKKDKRKVVCQNFLDALLKMECYGVLEILYEIFHRLKEKLRLQ